MVKRLLTITILIFLLLGLGVIVFLVRERTQLPSQAARLGIVSLENSYLFASPLLASANGQEKIRVTAFLLDDQGLGVEGKKVSLGQNQNLMVEPVQPATDSVGKAVFDLSTSFAAEYLVEVQVDGETFPQKVKVTFK